MSRRRSRGRPGRGRSVAWGRRVPPGQGTSRREQPDPSPGVPLRAQRRCPLRVAGDADPVLASVPAQADPEAVMKRSVPWPDRPAQVSRPGRGEPRRPALPLSTAWTRERRRCSFSRRGQKPDVSRPAWWVRPPVRQDLAQVVEHDHPVAQQAPPLLGAAGYRMGGVAVRAVRWRAWGLVQTHGIPSGTELWLFGSRSPSPGERTGRESLPHGRREPSFGSAARGAAAASRGRQ